jgi:hypothetical protein
LKTAAERAVAGDVANLGAAIERAAGDLALSEEPAGFQAALEAGGPAPAPPAAAPEARRD